MRVNLSGGGSSCAGNCSSKCNSIQEFVPNIRGRGNESASQNSTPNSGSRGAKSLCSKMSRMFIGAFQMTTKFLTIKLSWNFPGKQRFGTIFHKCSPSPTPPPKRNFYLYCRFGVSEFSEVWHLSPRVRHAGQGLLFRTSLMSAKCFARNSRARHGRADFMGACFFWFSLQENLHLHKIPRFRGGFWVWGGGGGEVPILVFMGAGIFVAILNFCFRALPMEISETTKIARNTEIRGARVGTPSNGYRSTRLLSSNVACTAPPPPEKLKKHLQKFCQNSAKISFLTDLVTSPKVVLFHVLGLCCSVSFFNTPKAPQNEGARASFSSLNV